MTRVQEAWRTRSVSRKCHKCNWRFRCPLEQEDRLICRACETKQGAKHGVAKEKAEAPPS